MTADRRRPGPDQLVYRPRDGDAAPAEGPRPGADRGADQGRSLGGVGAAVIAVLTLVVIV